MARLAVLLLILAMAAGVSAAGVVAFHRVPTADGTSSTSGTNGGNDKLILKGATLTQTGFFVAPEFYRSPDGTIVLLRSGGDAQTFAVFDLFDVDKGRFGQVIATSRVCQSADAEVNSSNQIVITCGTQRTTFPIP